jgi:hypothetical protein
MDQPAVPMLPPLLSPLSPLPTKEVFTLEQWTTLISILDTFIPSITNDEAEKSSKLCVGGAQYAESTVSIQDSLPPSVDQSLIASYLSESVSSLAECRGYLQRSFSQNVPADQAGGLGLILYALSTRLGALCLTGSTTPFHLQSPLTRDQIVVGWGKSYVPTLRALSRSFSLLAKSTWLALSPTFPLMIDFPAAPKHGQRGEHFPYDFLDFSSADSPSTIETDVIVVGSGCGAGVCAMNLAQAGFSVLVAEKGYHFPPSHFPMRSADCAFHLMENGGGIVSDDGSTFVLAGSCFGGGGTVNWSASLQTQHFVRQEWADQGLSFFTWTRCVAELVQVLRGSITILQTNPY